MHFPMLFSGLLLGPLYGLLLGILIPLLRSALFGMPPIFPTALAMAFELGTYGFVIGFLYSRFTEKSWKAVLFSLIVAMLSGRAVWGAVDFLLLGILGKSLTLSMFFSAVFLSSVPGILLQLFLIPLLMERIEKANAVHLTENRIS
nr:ECF transporter S component [uncultured Oribacterium sp.]